MSELPEITPQLKRSRGAYKKKDVKESSLPKNENVEPAKPLEIQVVPQEFKSESQPEKPLNLKRKRKQVEIPRYVTVDEIVEYQKEWSKSAESKYELAYREQLADQWKELRHQYEIDKLNDTKRIEESLKEDMDKKVAERVAERVQAEIDLLKQTASPKVDPIPEVFRAELAQSNEFTWDTYTKPYY